MPPTSSVPAPVPAAHWTAWARGSAVSKGLESGKLKPGFSVEKKLTLRLGYKPPSKVLDNGTEHPPRGIVLLGLAQMSRQVASSRLRLDPQEKERLPGDRDFIIVGIHPNIVQVFFSGNAALPSLLPLSTNTLLEADLDDLLG